MFRDTVSANYGLALRAPRWIKSPLKSLRLARSIAQERRALANLTPTRLADLGLGQTQAETESMRPVWDAPERWRC